MTVTPPAPAPDPDPGAGAEPAPTLLRLARSTDVDELVDFLVRGRAHLSGSRHPALFGAFVADSLGPRPRTTVAMAVREGEIAAALLAVNGDLPRYYRDLPVRHPRAAAALVAHRARKLPVRLRSRRRDRREAPAGAAPHARVPEPLRDEPRLRQGPLAPGQLGPRPTDHGPDIAFCLFVLVGADHRGTGLGTAILDASLRHLRSVGAARYDCSFAPEDLAATRLYLSMPFDIQRHPAGYFASIDLRAVEPRALPR